MEGILSLIFRSVISFVSLEIWSLRVGDQEPPIKKFRTWCQLCALSSATWNWKLLFLLSK